MHGQGNDLRWKSKSENCSTFFFVISRHSSEDHRGDTMTRIDICDRPVPLSLVYACWSSERIKNIRTLWFPSPSEAHGKLSSSELTAESRRIPQQIKKWRSQFRVENGLEGNESFYISGSERNYVTIREKKNLCKSVRVCVRVYRSEIGPFSAE